MSQKTPWSGSEAFSWLPEEGLETLGACFDLTEERIPAGESRDSEGRIGCLLSGRGRLRTESGETAISSVSLLPCGRRIDSGGGLHGPLVPL